MLTRDVVDTRLWINYLYLWPNYSVKEKGASKRCNKTLQLSLYVSGQKSPHPYTEVELRLLLHRGTISHPACGLAISA